MEDKHFARGSTVDFLIPQETDLDIEHALNIGQSPASEDANVLARIPQRTLLYFDEKVPIYAVLRTPYQDDETLQRYIPRLNIAIEAHAFSSPAIMSPTNEGGPAPTARDVIWASRLDVSEDPVFVVVGSDEDEDGHDVLLMWKMDGFLNRPRVRLQAPAVTFKVSATLQPQPAITQAPENEYLPSSIPLPANVLAPLNGALSDPESQVFLSASRIVPSPRPKGASLPENVPLRVVSRRAFRAIPAVSSRLRYHRTGAVHGWTDVTASLELDVPSFAQHPVQITDVGLSYADGLPQKMINKACIELPATSYARDNLICLFALDTQAPYPGHPTPPNRSLDVLVDARVLIADNCRPNILIRWRQTVDLTAIMQSAAMKLPPSIQRDNRPSRLSINDPKTGSTDSTTLFSSANVTATFMGATPIHVGEPFQWEVSIVNRSERARHFSITMIPKSLNADGGRGRLRSGTLPGNGGAKLADAVVDDNVLYGTIKAQDLEPAQLACLSPNAQTNAMLPGAVFTTQLEFLPLKQGYLHMEAIRITDLDSGDAMDARDLPDIVALAPPIARLSRSTPCPQS